MLSTYLILSSKVPRKMYSQVFEVDVHADRCQDLRKVYMSQAVCCGESDTRFYLCLKPNTEFNIPSPHPTQTDRTGRLKPTLVLRAWSASLSGKKKFQRAPFTSSIINPRSTCRLQTCKSLGHSTNGATSSRNHSLHWKSTVRSTKIYIKTPSSRARNHARPRSLPAISSLSATMCRET